VSVRLSLFGSIDRIIEEAFKILNVVGRFHALYSTYICALDELVSSDIGLSSSEHLVKHCKKYSRCWLSKPS